VSEAGVQRRLTTILAADVVGYSRLMAADEAGTLASLKTLRKEFIEPKTAEYGGRTVKLMGDGTLMEFASVVDAIRFAVDVQRTMVERNAGVPEGTRIAYRIGINIGDIIVDGEDIYGDGVNVAARLEGLAEPGGICVSRTVFNHVQGKVDTAFEDLGAQAVKNIPEPVQVYRALLEGVADTRTPFQAGSAAAPALPDKPSIAVLPFNNMSGDPEQEYFSDGITEDIITLLSRMPWFFVIARNSTFTYKGRAVDVTQVAHELGVRYVLEGSVRKAGQRVRITAQLIDATTGNHVWADRYDRDLADIFAVQDEVAENIAGAVGPEFLSVEAKRAQHKDPKQLDAWDCVMRGRWHLWRLARDDLTKAKALFERAIELVPSGEFGASDLAVVHLFEAYYNWSESRSRSLEQMMQAAKKAVAANDHDAWAYTTLAMANLFAHNWDEALPPVERAIELYPSFAPAIGMKGLILSCVDQPDAAIECYERAHRLSPHDSFIPIWLIGRTFAYFIAERYAEAAESAKEMVRLAPDNPTAHRQLASCYGMMGRIDDAKEALKGYLRLEPNHTVADVRERVPSRSPENLDRFVEGLRRAGLPD
jgi:adenylate cyclase